MFIIYFVFVLYISKICYYVYIDLCLVTGTFIQQETPFFVFVNAFALNSILSEISVTIYAFFL